MWGEKWRFSIVGNADSLADIFSLAICRWPAPTPEVVLRGCCRLVALGLSTFLISLCTIAISMLSAGAQSAALCTARLDVDLYLIPKRRRAGSGRVPDVDVAEIEKCQGINY